MWILNFFLCFYIRMFFCLEFAVYSSLWSLVFKSCIFKFLNKNTSLCFYIKNEEKKTFLALIISIMYRSFRRSLFFYESQLYTWWIYKLRNTFETCHPTVLALANAYNSIKKKRDTRIPLDSRVSRRRSTKITMPTALRRYTHTCQAKTTINGTDAPAVNVRSPCVLSQSHRPVLDLPYGRTPH